MSRFDGRRAFVSGAASGIGMGVTRRLVAEGASVVLLDIAVAEGEGLAEELGPPACFRRCDVTNEADWDRVVNEAVENQRVPDILINNAGGLIGSVALEQLSPEIWRQELELNLTSVFLGMRRVLPEMRRRGRGSVVNVSSVSGFRAQRDGVGYQAAKAGIEVLTKSAAVRFARDGVRVNSVVPSVVGTPALGKEEQSRTTEFISRVPMGRGASIDEVASAVCFLASEDASFITGANLVVDGGYLA
jgi:3alpha(or 20beta)-hydroxysteroid dehydrogenase